MADKKDGAAIAVFGALPKKGGAGMGGEDHDDARAVLVDALKDGDPETVADALHEYIMSCIPGGSSSKDEEEPMSSEEY